MSFPDKERYRTEYKRMVPHSLFFNSVAEHHLPSGDYNRIRIGGPQVTSYVIYSTRLLRSVTVGDKTEKKVSFSRSPREDGL